MAIGAETQQAGLWSRQAIERLTRDGVPPTPSNYAVYYRYFSGDLPQLNAAYDVFAARGKITQRECTDLYEKYIFVDSKAAFILDASSAIDKELKKVMDLIGASMKGTDKFGENLSMFSGHLANASSIDVLRQAVGKIVEETQTIAEQNHQLQADLATTTTKLSEMRTDFDRVNKESRIDPLTEVGNRKFFDDAIAHALEEAREQKSVLSLLMVDIDHFKKFNDAYGHLIGDQVLRLVARTLVENLKGRDIIARYGGEEFVILLPQTRVQDAEHVANQLRARIATKQVKRRGSNEVLGIVTISLGATEYRPGESADVLIARADAALYKAKQTGRNKVVCADTGSGA